MHSARLVTISAVTRGLASLALIGIVLTASSSSSSAETICGACGAGGVQLGMNVNFALQPQTQGPTEAAAIAADNFGVARVGPGVTSPCLDQQGKPQPSLSTYYAATPDGFHVDIDLVFSFGFPVSTSTTNDAICGGTYSQAQASHTEHGGTGVYGMLYSLAYNQYEATDPAKVTAQNGAAIWAGQALTYYEDNCLIGGDNGTTMCPYVEVLNEPAVQLFWGSGVDNTSNAGWYAYLLEETYNKFEGASSPLGIDAEPLLLASFDGGLRNQDWGKNELWKNAQDINVTDYINGVTVHPYSDSTNASTYCHASGFNESDVTDAYQDTHEPVFVTEVGWNLYQCTASQQAQDLCNFESWAVNNTSTDGVVLVNTFAYTDYGDVDPNNPGYDLATGNATPSWFGVGYSHNESVHVLASGSGSTLTVSSTDPGNPWSYGSAPTGLTGFDVTDASGDIPAGATVTDIEPTSTSSGPSYASLVLTLSQPLSAPISSTDPEQVSLSNPLPEKSPQAAWQTLGEANQGEFDCS